MYSFSLATVGGFVKAALRYFERIIEKHALLPFSEASSPDAPIDITYEEQFYLFNDLVKPDLVLLHSKIFGNLLQNQNTCKWVARNALSDLRYAFMVLSAGMRGGQGVDEEVARQVMAGLGEMLKCKEAVQLINKNTYISNWFFYRLFEVILSILRRLVRQNSREYRST